MNPHKLLLGTAVASLTSLGLIAIPTMIADSQGGPALQDNKILFFVDEETALKLGVDIAAIKDQSNPGISHDFADLKARYAGVALTDITPLKDTIDLAPADQPITREIHNMGTVAFGIGKQTALSLGFIDHESGYDDGTTFYMSQGASSELLVDPLDKDGNRIEKSEIAYFLNSDKFDDLPTIADAAMQADGAEQHATS